MRVHLSAGSVRAALRVMTSTALVALTLIVVTAPLQAQDTGSEYATWTHDGSGGDFFGTMTLPPGFPAAEWTSDSRANTGVISGATNWISEETDFGAVYGRSQDSPYLNLRPAADDGGSPSTTTYVFASPTPAAGWGFVVGDIDADMVEVSALDADGDPVAAADLGFEAVFNYCEPAPRAPSCGGAQTDTPGMSEPTPISVLITGNVTDTTGAAAWFEPTVALSVLTFEFTWQSGAPVYHTWFASITRTIAGTVTVDGTPGLGGVEITVFGPDGEAIATTVTADDGSYVFDGLGPVDDYLVTMTPPDTHEPVGPVSLPAHLGDDHATDVDFDLTLPLRTIAGTVTLDGDEGFEGVEVTLYDPEGEEIETTVTADDGTYVFAELTPADGYTVTMTPPVGYEPVGPVTLEIDLTDEDADEVDFDLTLGLYEVPGTVNGPDDEPLPNTLIELLEVDETPVDETVTDEDGEFLLSNVLAGDYLLVATPPTGFDTTTIPITVPLAEGDTIAIVVAVTAPTTTSTSSTTSSTSSTTTTSTTRVPSQTVLPRTGSESGMLALAGFGLVLIGAGIIAFARRRRLDH